MTETTTPAPALDTFMAQSPEQARLLLDIGGYPVLTQVLRGVVSAGEVARETGLPLKQAHHRLTRLCAAGLVEVCGERQRGGRPVKLYRARAASYRVPFSLTDAATTTELVQAISAPFMRAYAHALAALLQSDEERELLVQLNARGELQATLGDSQRFREEVHGVGTFTQVRLSGPDAAELERRLHELRLWASEHRQPEGEAETPGTASYLLALLLSPGSLRER
ncbi:helix-turn-helix transcriptional regulator [Deinococcus koreensis]|uniref:ArsR family transcriptional regulator n=1 Tax=Deinococcus koreensis TaxID=2054903 RepID=A0A2K3UW86_9DEIO|nr:helix-turn-helix transcriptional regulator [Deinococcus koreensis]PNY80780.1 hypothetical protein CVO96_04810 [Deinococcus koreensis]